MVSKLRLISALQLLIIIVLLFLLIKDNTKNDLRFISSRLNSGVLEPKSFLIVNYAPLRKDLESYINSSNSDASIYIENLRSGAFIGINERQGYPAASLNKVVIAITVMRKIDNKELSFDNLVEIKDEYKVDKLSSLYNSTNKHIPLRTLMEKMLKESDNIAFLALRSLVDKNERDIFLNYFDYYSEDSWNNNKPGEDYEFGLVTPKSMYNVFSSLYLSTVLEPESSDYILSLLSDTTFDVKKLGSLPESVLVSQKFGIKYNDKQKYLHSCGILYINESRVFYCVMTKNLSQNDAEKFIGVVVNKIYNYTISTRKALDNYKD